MSRRRWIYIDGEAVEITPGTVIADRASTQSHDGLLWNDRSYDGMRAPDGADISSRTKHREYMRRHGLTTADDFNGQWQREEKRREAYRTEGKGGAVTREHVARAIHELSKRR